jgi:hypothetical protein
MISSLYSEFRHFIEHIISHFTSFSSQSYSNQYLMYNFQSFIPYINRTHQNQSTIKTQLLRHCYKYSCIHIYNNRSGGDGVFNVAHIVSDTQYTVKKAISSSQNVFIIFPKFSSAPPATKYLYHQGTTFS